jgi:hypothetical protein
MSSSAFRRGTAVALIAGSLALLPGSAHALSGPRQARSLQAAPVSGGFLGSLWSLLVSLFAGDGCGGQGGHDGHGGGDPNTDEGPGMCPHGHP